MRRKNLKFTFGFTILELIGSISIFLIVILMVGSIYLLAQRSYNHGAAQNELIQNARVCLDRLSRELRQAAELVTDISATTTEIFFQDGHDDNEITYVKYFLSSNEFYRDNIVFYFPADPDVYVYYNSVDGFGNPAASTTLSSRIVGEYFNSLEFIGDNGLINIQAILQKNQVDLEIATKAHIRNY